MISIKNVIIVVLTLTFLSCSLSNEEIKQHEWKYGEGSRPGQDFLFFGGGVFKLTDDTIFFLDTAIAKLLILEKTIFYMTMKSL